VAKVIESSGYVVTLVTSTVVDNDEETGAWTVGYCDSPNRET